MRILALIFSLASALGGCTTPSVTLSSDQPAEVASLTFPVGGPPKRESLGKTPLTLEKAKVEGLMLEIKGTDTKPFVLYVPRTDSADNEIKVELEKAVTPQDPSQPATKSTESDPTQVINRIMRVIFKSTQALYENDNASAIELADQAIAMNPNIAGPQIIKGLAELNSGRTQEAKASLAKAKALDPENTDIDEIVRGLP